MIDNSLYGGFVVAKSVLGGKRIRYTYREESKIPQLNGWHILSEDDTDEYVSNPENFEVVAAQTLFSHWPQMSMIFDAPYGTDLFWLYTDGVHTGFFDLKTNREVSVAEILGEKNMQAEEKNNMADTRINYIPLGSIVLLKGASRKMLVISRGLQVNNNGKTVFFDYGGVLYPDGLTGDRMAYFNHDSIAKVVFEGYSDVDNENVVQNINDYLAQNPDVVRGDPKNW